MMRKNCAELICDGLRRRGVKVVFGIPGVHNLLLFEAMRLAGLRVVPATHEQAVALMANGYSRATGKTGVFVTVPGPGLTNAFTGVAEALLDSCAVVGLVTGVKRDLRQKFQLHQIEQVELVRPIVKSVATARQAGEVAGLLEQAFRVAEAGEPGPAILEVPANVLGEHVHDDPTPEGTEPARQLSPEVERDLALAMERIRQSGRVGMLVGQGAADASAMVRAMAEWLCAPVATTQSGRGCLREDHPLSLGFGWLKSGLEAVNQLFDTCDLILAIGLKFSENATIGYRLRLKSPLIHVDASREVIGQNYPAELRLPMDAREFCERLMAQKNLLGPREDRTLVEAIAAQKASCVRQQEESERIRFHVGSVACAPHEFFGALRRVLPEDAVVVTDSGYNQILVNQNFPVLAPRTLITPTDYQSMGYAVPAGIGAALGLPQRKVVAVAGDGGFMMSGFEILTAVRQSVNLLVIVLNDASFSLIREAQENLFGVATSVDLTPPAFEALARSLHVHYQPEAGGLEGTLRAGLQHKGPVLLEVKVQHPSMSAVTSAKLRWRRELKRVARKLI